MLVEPLFDFIRVKKDRSANAVMRHPAVFRQIVYMLRRPGCPGGDSMSANQQGQNLSWLFFSGIVQLLVCNLKKKDCAMAIVVAAHIVNRNTRQTQ
jgi:hypothetical protein